jgi:hypothetical protein
VIRHWPRLLPQQDCWFRVVKIGGRYRWVGCTEVAALRHATLPLESPLSYGSQMPRNRSASPDPTTNPPGSAQARLPKRALERIHLGQSFAEYDTSLATPGVYVRTPALNAAIDARNPHCFFVGRRGTGKTAITRYMESHARRVIVVRPEIFSPSGSLLNVELFNNTKQQPFRSLLAAFRRSLQDEVLFNWIENSHPSFQGQLPASLARESEEYSDADFDLRALLFIAALTRPLAQKDDVAWLAEIKRSKSLARDFELIELGADEPYTLVLDAIDDFWDGSLQAVIYLTALMHAALEINTQVPGMRVLMFLRENIFERVRTVDSEFSRLETCVVGLDWTEAQLMEMIERRVNAPLNTKLALGGPTWDAFFEDGPLARTMVLDYCQHKPRDVLTYCSLALDTAQANKHDKVMIEDLQDARRRYSDSRLKDLSDEYQENYPQIGLVLEKFYGLGQRFTTGGMEDFISKILQDPDVQLGCSSWIYDHSTLERFVRLLYDIGFLGLRERKGNNKARAAFRSLGPRDTTPPGLAVSTDLLVHPSYHQALELQDALVGSIGEEETFRRAGLILELPGALSLDDYRERVAGLSMRLKGIARGRDMASRYEELIGDVLKLCFFRPLTNVQEQSRDVDGTIRRDWIAANRAQFGFWEMMRQRYAATQVVFECKNYDDLQASDFQQAAYYMTDVAGKLVVVFFRGEIKNHHFQHIKRTCQNNGGMMLLLNDKDLSVFIRQALNGKVKDDHIQDRYDKTVRSLS